MAAKVEWDHDEPFPRADSIVTNVKRSANQVVHRYNQRGTAEKRIKEGKNAAKWVLLSCHHFADNQGGCNCLCWPTIWTTFCGRPCA